MHRDHLVSILTLLKLVNRAPNSGTNTTVNCADCFNVACLLTGNFNEETETCTVTVGDCPDYWYLRTEYSEFGGIPLSE